MELNMDGWGANEKYPHAFGEPYTSINRWYLKLKSELLPYAYSIAEESVSGLPMIRAMFLEYPNPYTLGKATQYQFLYGPYFLVAPVYQETRADKEGNDVRHGIYLPEGQWIDYFTGDLYEGGKIYNDVDAPCGSCPCSLKTARSSLWRTRATMSRKSIPICAFTNFIRTAAPPLPRMTTMA